MKFLFAVISVFALLPGRSTGQAVKSTGPVIARSQGLHGYIGFSATRPPAQAEYSAGMGFYSAVWPLLDQPLAGGLDD